MRKFYIVLTANGLNVFESYSKKRCQAYIRQAIEKGSKPGFLWILEAEIGRGCGL